MSLLQESVKQYLDSQEWHYDFNEEKRYYSLNMSLKCVDHCRIVIDFKGDENGDNGFVVYTFFPINVPENRRSAVSEFLTRANYGLLNGNFEMDFEDGEIRYKVMTRCGDIDYDPDSMEFIVDCGFMMFERYGHALLSVIYGNVDPKQAVEAAENE